MFSKMYVCHPDYNDQSVCLTIVRDSSSVQSCPTLINSRMCSAARVAGVVVVVAADVEDARQISIIDAAKYPATKLTRGSIWR